MLSEALEHLVRGIVDHPDDVATILKNWQAAAQKVWNS